MTITRRAYGEVVETNNFMGCILWLVFIRQAIIERIKAGIMAGILAQKIAHS